MIESKSELEAFGQGDCSAEEELNCDSLAKLSIDTVKENDIKFMFEVLATSQQNRTIADLDSLVKIMMHIQPIKRFHNMSAVYFLCKRMILTKFKTKDIIYDENQRADSLYIILHGKVAFYKKSTQYFDNDQVIFLNAGSCFGRLYPWRIKFIPISVEQSLLAVAPKSEVNKIPMHLSYQRQLMIQQLRNCDIFTNFLNYGKMEFMKEISQLLTLNKIPCGNFLLREGQTPKAIFYVMKGIVKKIITKEKNVIELKRFSQGQHCPTSMNGSYYFDLMAQTSCEVIVIPKKVLKLINSPLLNLTCPDEIRGQNINKELNQQKKWQKYKSNLLKRVKKQLKEDKLRNKYLLRQ